MIYYDDKCDEIENENSENFNDIVLESTKTQSADAHEKVNVSVNSKSKQKNNKKASLKNK